MPILNQYVGFLLNKSKISFYHTSNNSIPSTKHVPLRLLNMVDKPRRRAENDFKKAVEKGKTAGDNGRIVIRRYFKQDYKAKSWKREQRVIAKIEVSPDGTNIRFVVTKNRNNRPEHIYKRYSLIINPRLSNKITSSREVL